MNCWGSPTKFHHFVLEESKPGNPYVRGVCKYCAKIRKDPAFEAIEAYGEYSMANQKKKERKNG